MVQSLGTPCDRKTYGQNLPDAAEKLKSAMQTAQCLVQQRERVRQENSRNFNQVGLSAEPEKLGIQEVRNRRPEVKVLNYGSPPDINPPDTKMFEHAVGTRTLKHLCLFTHTHNSND